MSIIIYSRPVRRGKTTELMEYCAAFGAMKDIGGILMPDMGGKRKLFNIATSEYFEIECSDPTSSTRKIINVGKFHFYADAFEKANAIIVEAISNCNLLIIDEVGKLELESKGFYKSVNEVLKNKEFKNGERSVLLVVREELYEPVLSFFEITKHRLIKKASDI